MRGGKRYDALLLYRKSGCPSGGSRFQRAQKIPRLLRTHERGQQRHYSFRYLGKMRWLYTTGGKSPCEEIKPHPASILNYSTSSGSACNLLCSESNKVTKVDT